MQNEFEKQVQQQMEQFEVVPSDALWQKVEGQLGQEKKKRRFFFYWLTAASVILMITATFFLLDNNTSKDVASKANESHKKDAAPSINNIQQLPNEKLEGNDKKSLGKDNDITATVDDKTKANSSVSSSKSIKSNLASTGNKSLTRRRSVVASLEKALEDADVSRASINKQNEVLLGTSDISKSTDNSSNSNNSTTDASETVSSQINSNIDSNNTADAAPVPLKKVIDTAAKLTVSNTPFNPKSSTNRFKYGVVINAGLSNNISALIGLPSANALQERAVFSASSSTTSTAAANSYRPVINNFKSSLSVGIGVFGEVDISKRLSLTAGFNYHSYASELTVNSRIDSSRTFNDPLLSKRVQVNQYHRAGNQSSFINRYNLFQMPLDIMWRINNNGVKPLQLFMGMTPGLMVSNSALYYNPYQGVYYKEKQQFKKFQMAMETGLVFTVTNTAKHQLKVGPNFQYSLTNLTKRTVYTTEHLLFYGLKTSITIK